MCEQSFDEVMQQHQRLVHSIAGYYANKGLPIEDLRQEGLLGLYKAYQSYDPAFETKFSTYAVYWIKKQILKALNQETGINVQTEELSEAMLDKVIAPVEPASASQNIAFPIDMPDLERRIIHLSFAQNLCLKEIAAKLELSVEKVKQHKQKGIRRMRIANTR